MPFDFIKFRPYSINYDDLYYELNSKQIFNDTYLQSEYLKRWMGALQDCENTLSKELESKDSLMKLSLNMQKEPEIFQLPMSYNGVQVLLHFRVSAANALVSEHRPKSQHIPLHEFIQERREINWNPVDFNVDSSPISNKPIIMVPFRNNQYNFLVIDGNHRITYKVKNNIDDIEAYVFSEESVIDCYLFASGFDKFFYIMHNELNLMANASRSEAIDPLILVQKSYLKDAKFNFNGI